MGKYIMALDQGTTSSRCILFDKEGNIRSMAQKEIEQIYPKAGWVEHDPMEIWSSELSVMMECMAKVSVRFDEVESIGITNQRETVIVWDKATGEPVYNAIVWQCRRTADKINELQKLPLAKKIREKTGLIPDAYFSASKIWWILENVEGARERAERGELIFGTVDTWLIYRLTGNTVHATDYTNASRTMLFDIHNLCWDEEILEYFNIPKQMLPEVYPSSHLYGITNKSLFGGEIKICGVAGDQQAALFGQCCFEPGDVKNTYGTGCFLLMNTGHRAIQSKYGLLTTIAASTSQEVEYALEGSVFVGGAAVQWLRDGLQIIRSAKETLELATKVEDTNEMYIVPAFAGMGAPYWNPYARGTVVGITRGCERAHFVRATLESVAYQTYDVIQAMQEDAGQKLRLLKVDGGASSNDFLMQFQADINGECVERPKCIETTAMGAAFLAGLVTGYYKDLDEIRERWKEDRTFSPTYSTQDREKRLKGWKRAVKCAKFWAENEDD